MSVDRYFWMHVESKDRPTDLMVIDCGYIGQGGEKGGKLLKSIGLGMRNFVWLPSTIGHRLGAVIPKRKQNIVRSLKSFSDKKTWFGATHSLTTASINS